MTKAVATKPSPYPQHQLDRGVTTGRPTLYRPEYCETALRLGEEGKGTLAHIAVACGVSKNAVMEWGREFEDFGDALSRARAATEAFLFDQINTEAEGKGNRMAQNVRQFILRSIAPDTYGERTAVQHSGTIEVTVKHEYVDSGAAPPDVVDAEFTEVE